MSQLGINANVAKYGGTINTSYSYETDQATLFLSDTSNDLSGETRWNEAAFTTYKDCLNTNTEASDHIGLVTEVNGTLHLIILERISSTPLYWHNPSEDISGSSDHFMLFWDNTGSGSPLNGTYESSTFDQYMGDWT